MPQRVMGAFNWTVTAAMLLFVAWQLRSMFLPVPHIIHSAEPETPVRVGTPLCYWIDVTRNEICDPTVYRSFFREEDGQLRFVWRTITPGGVGGVGKRQKYRACTADENGNLLPLPPQITPGRYVSTAYVVNHNCRSRGSYTTTTPNIRFEVEP